jgi:hypothetical protein
MEINLNIPEREIEQIVLRVLEERGQRDDGADEHRRKLALINAKEVLTAREAAFLLGCSDGHMRNLVRKAKKGGKNPVPFYDLDGVYTYPREELLQWAGRPKPRLKAVS